MSINNKAIINTESSQKLIEFLEKNNLHKRDFAEMIGVTLSYVYNLIDNAISFSTRTTTLERIAAVMEIDPEEFPEYKIPEEPIHLDEGIEFLKQKQYEKGLSTVQFLKAFPRRQRVEIVDIWRGAKPLPLDWRELSLMAQILDVEKEEIYPYWESRMRGFLQVGGLDIHSNTGLLSAMFDCARKYIHK